jgi:hypothetical protein
MHVDVAETALDRLDVIGPRRGEIRFRVQAAEAAQLGDDLARDRALVEGPAPVAAIAGALSSNK